MDEPRDRREAAARRARAPDSDRARIERLYHYNPTRRAWRQPSSYRNEPGYELPTPNLRTAFARKRKRRSRLVSRLTVPLRGAALRNFEWNPQLALTRTPWKAREQAAIDLQAATRPGAQGKGPAQQARSRSMFARGFDSAVEAVRGGLIKGPKYRRMRLGDDRESELKGHSYIGSISAEMQRVRAEGKINDADRKVRAQKILAEASKRMREKGGSYTHVERKGARAAGSGGGGGMADSGELSGDLLESGHVPPPRVHRRERTRIRRQIERRGNAPFLGQPRRNPRRRNMVVGT